MKRMNLLFLGGNRSGKTSFLVRALYEATHNAPDWLNLKFSILNEQVNGAIQGNFRALECQFPPSSMHTTGDYEICTLSIEKRNIFWFSLLIELFQKVFFMKPITELGGVQIRIFEMSVENPNLGTWLMNHPANRTPLGVILLADPYATGKSCDDSQAPSISAVVERVVDRFEQIYVNNPEKRLPVSVALIVSKSEAFKQMRDSSKRYINQETLHASRRVLRDADGIYSDSYLLDDILNRQSQEIEEILERYDGNFVHILKNEFRKVAFFWSGMKVESDKKSQFCRLSSPLLPILWLLGEQMEL